MLDADIILLLVLSAAISMIWIISELREPSTQLTQSEQATVRAKVLASVLVTLAWFSISLLYY